MVEEMNAKAETASTVKVKNEIEDKAEERKKKRKEQKRAKKLQAEAKVHEATGKRKPEGKLVCLSQTVPADMELLSSRLMVHRTPKPHRTRCWITPIKVGM
jgi:hypothetical protein